jgi:hypothetical protein
MRRRTTAPLEFHVYWNFTMPNFTPQWQITRFADVQYDGGRGGGDFFPRVASRSQTGKASARRSICFVAVCPKLEALNLNGGELPSFPSGMRTIGGNDGRVVFGLAVGAGLVGRDNGRRGILLRSHDPAYRQPERLTTEGLLT